MSEIRESHPTRFNEKARINVSKLCP